MACSHSGMTPCRLRLCGLCERTPMDCERWPTKKVFSEARAAEAMGVCYCKAKGQWGLSQCGGDKPFILPALPIYFLLTYYFSSWYYYFIFYSLIIFSPGTITLFFTHLLFFLLVLLLHFLLTYYFFIFLPD